MAVATEDLNVFDLPHNRMKMVVGEIEQQVSSTNYGDEVSFQHMLCTLNASFSELESHEAIEDRHIIHPLLPRLHSSTQVILKNDIHSDDQLEQLHARIREQLQLGAITSPSERVHFGEELQAKWSSIKLIPHMDEEEQVFQPLLLQYFTGEELRVIKQTVLQLHNLPLSLCQKESAADNSSTGIIQLPPEVILHIFCYLTPRELCRCAQVHSKFHTAAFEGSLWRHVHPVRWLSGDWKFYPPANWDAASLRRLADNGCEEIEDDDDCRQPQLEPTMAARLCDMVTHLLPMVGAHVKTMNLSHAGHMEIKYLYQALSLCPSLSHLDLSYTSTSDFAFTGLIKNHSASRIDYINLSGCGWITDLTLERLARAYKPKPQYTPAKNCRTIECNDTIPVAVERPRLCCLRLSGCHLITDKGLRALGSVGELPELKFLDLSGVPNITAHGLNSFLSKCPSLEAEMLFYCDNITNGPFHDTANGCQNNYSSKFCCQNLH